MTKSYFFRLGYTQYRILKFLSEKPNWIDSKQLYWHYKNNIQNNANSKTYENLLKGLIFKDLIIYYGQYNMLQDIRDNGIRKFYFRIEELRKFINDNGKLKINHDVVNFLPVLKKFFIRVGYKEDEL